MKQFFWVLYPVERSFAISFPKLIGLKMGDKKNFHSIKILWKFKNLTSQAQAGFSGFFQVGLFSKGVALYDSCSNNYFILVSVFFNLPSSLLRAQAGYWVFGLCHYRFFKAQAGYWFSLVFRPLLFFTTLAGYWVLNKL